MFEKSTTSTCRLGLSLMTLSQANALILWADTSRGCSDPDRAWQRHRPVHRCGRRGRPNPSLLPELQLPNIAGDFYNRHSLTNQYSMGNYRGCHAGDEAGSAPDPRRHQLGPRQRRNQSYHRSSLSSSQLRNGNRIVANWSDGNGMPIVGATRRPQPRRSEHVYPVVRHRDVGLSGSARRRLQADWRQCHRGACPIRRSPQPSSLGDVPALTDVAADASRHREHRHRPHRSPGGS